MLKHAIVCNQYVPAKVEEIESIFGPKILTPCKGFSVEESPVIPLRNLGEYVLLPWMLQIRID